MEIVKKYLWACIIVMMALCACLDEEKFDTGAGDSLSFSEDTLRFDTVFSAEGTTTKSLMVYNRNKEGASITNVQFEGGKSKGFRVNVDGMYINEGLAQSISIRGNDSLYVFVELTPESFDKDVPIEISQKLIFTLSNGVTQFVTLQAFSQDAITLKAVHTKGNVVYDAVRPYRVLDSLTVEKGDTMFMEAGTRFLFHTDAFLRVDGTLICRGTLEKPVVLRGDRMDMMFEGQPYDRIPHQWKGIHFTETSYGNHLNYCDIHSAYDGIVCDSSDVQKQKLFLENSIVHNMGRDGLRFYSTKALIGNCQITNANVYCVNLFGGDVEFIHCTIAHFYRFSNYSLRGLALHYANFVGDVAYPIINACFRNCIVTGLSEDEIAGEMNSEMGDVDFNYGFYNCLLNTPEDDKDAQIVGCYWDNKENEVCREDNFEMYFNDETLLSSFKLVEKSAARGVGDTSVSEHYYPYDILGVLRSEDGQSDAGCYEFVPTQTDNKE